MRTPQSGIFALGTSSHSLLEFDLASGADPHELLQHVADLSGPGATTGGVNFVVGVNPNIWRALEPRDIPTDVHGFEQPITGTDGFTMPATQHDLWLWSAGHARDRVFDISAEAIRSLSTCAVLREEMYGWTYKDSRDLTGFIDGSANPPLLQAPEVAVIPDGEHGAGGSVVLVQKWPHKWREWEALPVDEQERVIGRTKLESVELPPEVRGPAAHVSRTIVEENGVEQPIFRRNTPYGNPTDHGTMFIGFCARQRILHLMLEQMAGVGDRIRDALTNYSVPVTGAYYFVPSVESLRAYATPEE